MIIESGANYCIESMNALDYANEEYKPKKVMAVHLAGDYGDDAAAGAKLGVGEARLDVHRREDRHRHRQAGRRDRGDPVAASPTSSS